MQICFEDDYILIVNKPNNVLVHHSTMAKNQQDEKSLVQLLFDKYQLPFYPVHRLDRKTSGLVVFAKEKQYVSAFQTLFTSNSIQKIYYGLVRGFIPEKGIIDTPVKGRDALVYKEALTHYTCLKTFEIKVAVGPYPTSRYSLVKLEPKTGRLHQLRIHMNKISHPLIGDPKYGDRFHNRMFMDQIKSDKLFLHAKELAFIHPYTQKNQLITADFPEHWLFTSNMLLNNLIS
ncbi:pseudouridine synthase [Pseudofulvibacter geojedonensis]|uniref:Pseudouridine synthase n=1 Tax=Pseudofulvibacter geojedonensis TaxID=1123758 RepID=A0ABW3HYN5_9FLAO